MSAPMSQGWHYLCVNTYNITEGVRLKREKRRLKFDPRPSSPPTAQATTHTKGLCAINQKHSMGGEWRQGRFALCPFVELTGGVGGE